MNNSHIIKYKKFKWFVAAYHHHQLAQWFLYAEWQKEIDPDWKPYTEDEVWE